MAERYQKLRLEVQTANDAGQLGCSYADIARRVVRAGNNVATAAFAPLARKATPTAKAAGADQGSPLSAALLTLPKTLLSEQTVVYAGTIAASE